MPALRRYETGTNRNGVCMFLGSLPAIAISFPFSNHSSPNHSSSPTTISSCAEKVPAFVDNCFTCCHWWTRLFGDDLRPHTLLCKEKQKSKEAR